MPGFPYCEEYGRSKLTLTAGRPSGYRCVTGLLKSYRLRPVSGWAPSSQPTPAGGSYGKLLYAWYVFTDDM